MASDGENYRRLPGRRRGIGSSSSLWLGSDHILLVKSSWFRERYKRFYLRDIQAITMARCPRFFFSWPMLALVLIWFLPALGMLFGSYRTQLAWGAGAILIVAGWLAVSLTASCRCRLYTAVSRDDLPSLYRIWSARRFLNRVQARIDEVQGALQPGMVEMEPRNAGPSTVPASMETAPAAGSAVAADPAVAARSHTLTADLFVLSLVIGSLADFSVARFNSTGWLFGRSFLTLLQLALAIAVLIQRYRRILRPAMQRVAVAALLLIGAMFYVQSFSLSMMSAFSGGVITESAMPAPVILIHQIAGGVRLLIALIGLAVILRGEYRGQPDIIGN
jgi:hypothetical protein